MCSKVSTFNHSLCLIKVSTATQQINYARKMIHTWHKCFCPKGQSGNGTKEEGCHKKDVVTKVVIGKQQSRCNYFKVFFFHFLFNLFFSCIYVLLVCKLLIPGFSVDKFFNKYLYERIKKIK